MTQRVRRVTYLFPVYAVMLVTIFVLPFYSAPGYSILKHTTSQLAAQSSPNAWIMNLVFILLGAAAILEAWRGLKGFWFHKIILTVFGVGLILTALYQHAPITEGVPYSVSEDALHSIFATVVGFSFTIFAFSAVFIEVTVGRRALAILMGVAATALSMLMSAVPDITGLLQRLVFIVSFAWLIFFFRDKDGSGH